MKKREVCILNIWATSNVTFPDYLFIIFAKHLRFLHQTLICPLLSTILSTFVHMTTLGYSLSILHYTRVIFILGASLPRLLFAQHLRLAHQILRKLGPLFCGLISACGETERTDLLRWVDPQLS